MEFPTPFILALSQAVEQVDPSIPSKSREKEYWLAVASYAEAFPLALAKRMEGSEWAGEERHEVAIEGLGSMVSQAVDEIHGRWRP